VNSRDADLNALRFSRLIITAKFVRFALLCVFFQLSMPKRRITASYIADHIRRVLRDGGSAPHSEEVQRFFKDEVQSRGWRTAELRKVAVRFRRQIAKERGKDFVLAVADKLFDGRILEEKLFAVFLLEGQTGNFGEREFRLFESWLDRIGSWADHDGLVHYLIAPMIAADPNRSRNVFRWAKSTDRWRRRAACVSLIRAARSRTMFAEIKRLSNFLMDEEDDMVQKGLGWLLRESAKADARTTVPYLMSIRAKAPRLVLRTACETLSADTRNKILVRDTIQRVRSRARGRVSH
jgi:3-methyladenine DNA glycosylase AlkD